MENIESKKKELQMLIRESSHISAYIGSDMIAECGYIMYNGDDEAAYDLESEFGADLYLLCSARYYETRTSQFFDFYRRSIVQEHEPIHGFQALRKLEEMDKLKSIISKDIYILARRAGCRNTIELSGNIYDNRCQKCGRQYPLSYIMRSRNVPLCEACKDKIRPKIMLNGETRDNAILTKAANAIEGADVLLVLGAHLNDVGDRDLLRYYKGSKLAVIHTAPQLGDEGAACCIKGGVNDTLAELVDSLYAVRKE